ncbi:MAG: hypothetical protein ABIS50_09395 [Luteolibacter sp.]|uniref:hypothetical protein n=1 Tax=Luteolibacter sp. TaxID=1962973 RepID=UPI003266735B
MNVEVTRYRKPDGFATRHWAVLVNGELLVVTLFRKGADAVAQPINNLIMPNKPEPSQFQPGQTPVTPEDLPEGAPANVEPIPPDGIMLPQLESEAARRKRRRKGLRREILGEAPF